MTKLSDIEYAALVDEAAAAWDAYLRRGTSLLQLRWRNLAEQLAKATIARRAAK